jgi:hypothetical protein
MVSECNRGSRDPFGSFTQRRSAALWQCPGRAWPVPGARHRLPRLPFPEGSRHDAGSEPRVVGTAVDHRVANSHEGRGARVAGSDAWTGPWGYSVASNLTPDADTGIGKRYTETSFISTMRTGKKPSGPPCDGPIVRCEGPLDTDSPVRTPHHRSGPSHSALAFAPSHLRALAHSASHRKSLGHRSLRHGRGVSTKCQPLKRLGWPIRRDDDPTRVWR